MTKLHPDLWSTITPRRWQEEALPLIIDAVKQGKKPIISAIMGSGKSVLIAELCWLAMQKLKPYQHIVVTAPRQSLVNQLHQTIERRCGVNKVGKFFTYQKDTDCDIVVCCNASAVGFADQKERPKIAMLIGDEVHATESDRFKMAFEMLNPACAIGFTATPFRSQENQSLSLWTDVAYRYDAAQALADKVIVPWKLKHWDGTGADAKDVDHICMLMMFGVEGPGIINALDIEDAKKYTEYLMGAGIKAAPIHSKIQKHRQGQLIRKLQHGELDCLVHVNLLSEGVDMPWLRWICLRRPVSAKVRFCQEVGRVLRAHEGKEFAWILDPHDLFSRFGLTHPEKIGEIMENEKDDELASLVKDKEEREILREMPPAVAYGRVESWVVSLHSTLSTHKLCESLDMNEIEMSGRKHLTDWQRRTIRKCGWSARYLPDPQRKKFKELWEVETNLRSLSYKMGECILKILWGLADVSKEMRQRHLHWTMPKNILLPELEMFSSSALLFRSFSSELKSPGAGHP